jgi:hypothetical protein
MRVGLPDLLVQISASCMIGRGLTVILESVGKEFPSWFVDFSPE